jgi:hypothetical protein
MQQQSGEQNNNAGSRGRGRQVNNMKRITDEIVIRVHFSLRIIQLPCYHARCQVTLRCETQASKKTERTNLADHSE